MDKGERKKRIEKLLMDNFNPNYINVVDDSMSHIGHMGAQEGGETHYNIEIESKVFIIVCLKLEEGKLIV